MTRMLIHVEGETEETFVNRILAPYLYGYGYSQVGARLMGNSRLRSRRGGIRSWLTVKNGVAKHLKEDPNRFVAVMVDYYGLPSTGSGAWPGRKSASSHPVSVRGGMLENRLLLDIQSEMGATFNPKRFIPYVMMHEFEAMMFSDCKQFGNAIARTDLVTELQRIRDEFSNPEEIDDDPNTAPSKRIQELVPNYQKPLNGVLITEAIGLDMIRAECPHFDSWINRLESLPTLHNQ